MSSDTAPLPVSPLRARMIEDMIVRGFKEDTPRLRAKRPSIRGLHRPVAGHGNGGRPAPVPTATDTERHAAAEHQQRGLGLALLLRKAGMPEE